MSDHSHPADDLHTAVTRKRGPESLYAIIPDHAAPNEVTFLISLHVPLFGGAVRA
jgi:hypothetical protein